MSEIWPARDTRTGARVAIKRSMSAERRFSREVEVQTAAGGRHTMPILEVDPDFGWYVMPWAERNLREAGPSVDLVGPVVAAVADSLSPVHVAGHVHRDLKPQNILWLDDGDQPARWVVADFGIVRNALGATTAQLTHTSAPLGTDGWLAPEQYREAHSATPRSDVFAVGAIVSWLTTKADPRPGDVTLPSGKPFRHIVWRAARPRPADRYANLVELEAAVRAAVSSTDASLASMVNSKDFAGLVSFSVDYPAAYLDLVDELPQLQAQGAQRWHHADADGLMTSVTSTLDSLVDTGTQSHSYDDIDTFLNWSRTVVELDIASDRERAEITATALFRAIATVHQFTPARFVLDWLDRLDADEQDVMETALLNAGAQEFFANQAKNRFAEKRQTRLVRRLAGDLPW